MAVIGDFGPLSYKLALPLEYLSKEENEIWEEREENEENETEIETISISSINSVLESIRYDNIPWRDMKAIIEMKFGLNDLILYKFGQKQDIKDFVKLLDKTVQTANVEVAIGTEIELPGKMQLN